MNPTSDPYPATEHERRSAVVRLNRVVLSSWPPVKTPSTGPEVHTFTRFVLGVLLFECRRGEAHWSGLAYGFEHYPHRRYTARYTSEVFFRQLRPAFDRGLLLVDFDREPQRVAA